MLIEILDCSQYVLNDRINEFEQDHKVINITFLFKAPANIISIIEFTTTVEYKKQLAKKENEEKLESQKKEANQYLR